MHNCRINNKKGIVLFIVLATIFIVILLGNIILSIMSSQSRLTHHQVSRIQAYYSAMAGANYAFDKLRRADDLTNWPIPAAAGTYSHCLCRTLVGNCGVGGPACDMADGTIPNSVQWVLISVAGNGVAGCNPPGNVPACINATATYTYTP